MSSSHEIDILLIEDNYDDVLLTKEVLIDAKVKNTINAVEDGEEAMQYLLKQGEYSNKPTPDLIILDLNLPKKDGREVLIEIKENEHLKSIPVIILTTSKSEEDILQTYNNHANAYITKPVDFDQFINIIKSLKEFWLSIVKFPPK